MGPGILTRYSKQVLGGLLAVFAIIAAVLLYFRLRSPVCGVSPYEYINAWGEERIVVTTEQPVYDPQAETVQVTIRNDAESGWVIPGNYRLKEWVLETEIDGVWYSMRTLEKYIDWDFPAEDKTPNSRPSGIVKCGEEQRFLCHLEEAYELPLAAGTYRIVFPNMEKEREAYSGSSYLTAFAAEFEVK